MFWRWQNVIPRLISWEWRYVGLWSMKPMSARDLQQLNNLHYLFCNINTALVILLESLPLNTLQWVSIQFPDPWFKQRTYETTSGSATIGQCFGESVGAGWQNISAIRYSISRRADARSLSHPFFSSTNPSRSLLEENPFPIPTEREIATQAKPMPVYRVLITKH